MPEINPLPVSSRTREKLQEVKSEGESYDDLLQRLVLVQHRYDLSARYHEVAAADLEALHDLDDIEPQPMRDDTPEEPARGVGKPAVDEDPTDRHTHREGPGDPDTSDEGPEGDSGDDAGAEDGGDADADGKGGDADAGDDGSDTDADDASDADAGDGGGDAGAGNDGGDAEATDDGGDAGETSETEADGESGPFGGSGEGADDE